MLWMFLRSGWANTAVIFALALVPVITLASVALEPAGAGHAGAGLQAAVEATETAEATELAALLMRSN